MDESKRGRNLAVLSFAVILYILGGASFNANGTLFGGSVDFARTWVLEYASITLLGFYLYRFWIASPLLRNVKSNTKNFLQKSDRLRQYIQEIGQIALIDCIDKDEMLGGIRFSNTNGRPWPNRVVWDAQNTPLIYNVFRRKAIVAGVSQNSSVLVTFEVNLSWWRCFPYDLWATLQGNLQRDEFWEDIFPIVLAFIAFTLILVKKAGLFL